MSELRCIFYIKTESRKEELEATEKIHNRLVGNQDYIDSRIVLNMSSDRNDGTTNEVRIYVFEDATTDEEAIFNILYDCGIKPECLVNEELLEFCKQYMVEVSFKFDPVSGNYVLTISRNQFRISECFSLDQIEPSFAWGHPIRMLLGNMVKKLEHEEKI